MKNKRLIEVTERNELIDLIQYKVIIDTFDNGEFIETKLNTEEIVDFILSEGFRKVVHCKDCKYFHTKPNYCSKICSDDIDKEFYCKYGEKG